MPCSDSNISGKEVVYVETKSMADREVEAREQTLRAEIYKLTKDKEWLEAALCATMNELEVRGIAPQVMAEASRNGQIDLMTFWSDHVESDEARIAAFVHRSFSKDEQKILKRLLLDEGE